MDANPTNLAGNVDPNVTANVVTGYGIGIVSLEAIKAGKDYAIAFRESEGVHYASILGHSLDVVPPMVLPVSEVRVR